MGFLYLIFGGFSSVLGTTMSILVRIELSQPGSQVLLGNHQLYNILVTGRAILMIFFMVMPTFIGGFGNFCVPLMVSASYTAFPAVRCKKSSLDLALLGVSVGEFLGEDYAPFVLAYIIFVVSCVFIASLPSFLGTRSKTVLKGIQTFLEEHQDTLFMLICGMIFLFLAGLYSLTEAIVGAVIMYCLAKLLLLAESKNSKTFEFLLVGVFLIRVALNRVDLAILGYFLLAGFLYQVLVQFKSSEPLTVFLLQV